MHLYPPVGSISTQLMQQKLAKLKALKKRRAPHAPHTKIPHARVANGPKVPDLQQLARQAANRSLGIRRPRTTSGNLEAAARKAAGSSLRGWR